MKILKILLACFAVLILSSFFVFELIFSRSVYNSLSAYAEENITSDSVEPLSGDDPDPSIIDYHWDLSGFEQYNLNLFYSSSITINAGSEQWLFYSTDTLKSWGLIEGKTYSIIAYNLPDGILCQFIPGYYSLANFVYTFIFTSGMQIRIGNNIVSQQATFVPQVMLVEGSYTSETIPVYQPNLKYIFTTGFTNGYKDGYDTGYDSGRNYGYNLGYSSGYDTGYSYGRNSQISEGLFKNPLDVFLQPISNFLNTDIFGSFSIGDGFTIAFFVMIALIFIKMFAGG